jgi:3-phenylpropionate/trans-cinnamate dioxygenase ferredoxin subunit
MIHLGVGFTPCIVRAARKGGLSFFEQPFDFASFARYAQDDKNALPSYQAYMSEHKVARVSDVPPGTTKRVEADGVELMLCNVDGEIYAIEDVCTHDGGPLDLGELEGHCIVCPRHGATFDVRTGAALTLPAVLPVATFPLRIDGDDVYVDA